MSEGLEDHTLISTFAGFSEARAHALFRQFAVAACKRVIQKSGDARVQFTPPRPDAILQTLERSGAACWRPEFGAALATVEAGGQNLAAGLAQLLVALAGLGLEGEFRVTLPAPAELRWQERWFRCYREVTIRASAGVIGIKSPESDCNVEIRSDAPCSPFAADSALLPGLRYVWGYAIDPAVLEPTDAANNHVIVQDGVPALEAALSLVQATDEAASSWVGNAIRMLSVTYSNGSRDIASRSSPRRPGNVQIAAPEADALHCAEILVHEAAHQYFYLCGMHGAYVAEGASGRQFYSTLKRAERPLDRLLLAYHAVVNVQLLIDMVDKKFAAMRSRTQQRVAVMASHARSFEQVIGDNVSLLSWRGNALFGALRTASNRLQ